MKPILLGLISIIFILTACASATQAAPVVTTQNATTTPSPLPTATATWTSLPSATPTASITPLPAIPTFTPTFDVSTIVTVTPAPQAECPQMNNDTSLELPNKNDPYLWYDDLGIRVLVALNSGMPVENVILELVNQYRLTIVQLDNKELNPAVDLEKQNSFSIFLSDITNDEKPELIINNFGTYIFTCQYGEYKSIYSLRYDGIGYMKTTPLLDINKNGVNEIAITQRGCSWARCGTAKILEWDGESLHLLLDIDMDDPQKYYIEDTNNDDVFEFIFEGGIPLTIVGEYIYDSPWRYETRIYRWNGKEYIPELPFYTTPEYRFQAIQDADRAALNQDFNIAFLNYQEVINNSALDWWSMDRKYNLIKQAEASWEKVITPTPVSSDLSVYPRLAAYAYYRIILLHLVQGHEVDATTVYNTLQEKFGNDQYGQPYVEMATAFWEAYQSTQKMYAGCAAAIQYAVEHPDILIPLGSDYHGWQSHQYKPEDVCPFR